MSETKEKLRRVTLAQLREMDERGELHSPGPNAAEIDIPNDIWDKMEPLVATSKTSVHLRVDTDVLEWFKAAGPGHLTRMNAVLRHYFLVKGDL